MVQVGMKIQIAALHLLLKEMLVAGALLGCSSDSFLPLEMEGRQLTPQLSAVVPVFVGRQQPQGHQNYPCMGS